MDTKVRQTNTTELDAVLTHDDIVGILGLAAMMQAGIARDQPGTTVRVALVPVDGSDQFTAGVSVVIDHNFVPPAPATEASVAVEGSTAPQSADAAPPAPVLAAPLAGLAIPTVPPASA